MSECVLSASSYPNIQIVLVETSHPGNIGAAARAMKNMGLDQLVLVKPHYFPSEQAIARASGADDILQQSRTCDSLLEAIAGCQLVIGCSARLRSVKWPLLNPRECADTVVRASQQAPVAIVFGREHSGLTNEELDYCHFLMHIPTNPDFQSLNLAAAVQVVAYEIGLLILTNQVPTSGDSDVGQDDYPLASAYQVELFYVHLETTLKEIGFLNPPNCKKLMRQVKRIFHRARLDVNEVNILRGILSAAQGRKYRRLSASQEEVGK